MQAVHHILRPRAASTRPILRQYLGLGFGLGDSWRTTLLLTATLGGLLLTAMTELLGAFRLLAHGPVVAVWGSACAGLLAWFVRNRRHATSQPLVCDRAQFTQTELLFLGYLAAVVAFTAVLAWVAPPNTWDSQTYHMSRVMHWIQNRTVDFYPTAILRQLHSNPWAEYLILHFQLLTGTDRLANFVQWASMVGSLVGSSAIAKELGAERCGQIIAAVACATIPMGVLQSTSTQTDYVVAFWLVCLVFFCMRLAKRPDLPSALGVGGALGLAILTKGTAYVFSLPFIAFLAMTALGRRDRKLLLFVGLACTIAFVSNAAHYARNLDLYGSPLGPGTEGAGLEYNNQRIDAAVIASNLLRNAGLHMGTSESLNHAVERSINTLHKVLGISPRDPATTWPGTSFQVQRPSMNEDNAGNPVHLVLISIALLLYACGFRRDAIVTAYVAAVVVGFLIFCIYLKWQPWHSRLHLPLFVLWAPLIGLFLSNLSRAWAGNILAVMMILSSAPNFVFSQTKPATGSASIFTLPRDDQYFSKRPDLLPVYNEAASRIKALNCADVGIMTDIEGWEYPLWVLLKDKASNPNRIKHVAVGNASQRKSSELESFEPCALFLSNREQTTTVSVAGKSYALMWSSGGIGVYIPR
ncbi:MAG: hypothetical protein EOP76_14190 [Variovorax sp.]|nr:MAG: hypothetical protein EOP76_14190 [Variovorax sp.]